MDRLHALVENSPASLDRRSSRICSPRDARAFHSGTNTYTAARVRRHMSTASPSQTWLELSSPSVKSRMKFSVTDASSVENLSPHALSMASNIAVPSGSRLPEQRGDESPPAPKDNAV